jgi:methyl-accepting chemotaxis protein
MLQRFRIGTRLTIGFGGVIAATTAAFVAAVAIGVGGQSAIRETDGAAAQRIDLVRTMRESQLQLVSAIRSAGLQTDGGAINKEVEVYKAALKSLATAEAAFAALPRSDEERALLDKASALRKQAEPAAEEAIGLTMTFAGDQAAKVLTERFAPIEREWANQFVQLQALQLRQADAAKAAIDASNRERLLWLSALLVTVTGAGAAFAWAMTRSVTRPLREAAHVAARVAEGDLAVRIDASGHDEAAELLRSLQTMAQQLASMVSAVRESAESIDTASREITQGNLDLSSRTETQASSVQQTAATLTELTDMVNHTATNAQTMRGLTERTAEVAQQGGEAMSHVSTTMSRISESSRRINDIIGVIDGIAFQTNILALNAAVEAARAGEQGRGFAVVASEVRSLAQRVTQAAAEVRTLIAESVQRVDDGARQVEGLGTTLADLQGSVERVRTLVGEITTASADQSQNIVQVNHAVRSIDQTTQQNSALVEQVAAAAQSLSGQTERLTGLVRRFRVSPT